jgi:hypothetical protein
MINKCKTCSIEFKNSNRRIYCDNCLVFFKKEHAKKNSYNGGKARWGENHKYAYTANGYIMTKVPKHPLANGRGYVYIHRIVMEKHLGRVLLKEEVVHHKDGNKMNNKIGNLVLFRTTAEHTKHHLRNGDIKLKRFSNNQIKEIRLLRKHGKNLNEIGKKFRTSESTISKICIGDLYKHVKI